MVAPRNRSHQGQKAQPAPVVVRQHGPMDVDTIVAGFEARTLPKAAWTHEAHLAVCWATVRRLGADSALTHLRDGIRSYNEATDTVNSDSSGYHETLTRYYIGAIADLGLPSIDAVIEHPLCSRAAPQQFWGHQQLFSVGARRGWIDPDLAPLPFAVPGLGFSRVAE